MITALLFLQTRALKNRVRTRLRRLRRPKYLIGAIAGALYCYGFFVRQWVSAARGGAGHAAPAGLPAELAPVVEPIAAMGLLAVLFMIWVWPHRRAALEFTEAEVAFLFPAPVARRTLVQYKLLKSQTAILLSALFVMLFSGWLARGGSAWTRYLGFWLLLSLINLHLLGCSFAQTLLVDRGLSPRRLRWIIWGALAGALAATVGWAWRSVSRPTAETFASLSAVTAYVQHTAASGPLRLLLYPLRLAVRPLLAQNAHAFLLAVGPAVLLLALHYVWVIVSDVAFEEASVEASRRLAAKVAAIRAGKDPFAAALPRRRHNPPFRLRPAGPPWIALLWKNVIAAGQVFSLRLWFILAWVALVGVLMAGSLKTSSGLLSAVGAFALGLLGLSLVAGPQLLRADLRQDLAMADLLKTYPMRGWQVVLGEILAPAVILTGVQWLLLLVAVGTLGLVPGGHGVPLPLRAALGIGVAVLAPLLNGVSLLIQNAAVLLFPAWVQVGPGTHGGIEVMGQRLIFLAGQVLSLLLALIPAALVGAVVFFPARFLAGLDPAIVLGAAAGALILAAESALAVWVLGRWFERFDLSSESVETAG